MATPYLKQPNYLGAMQTGLSNKLAYDKFYKPRIRGSVSSGGRKTEQAAPAGSPEDRAKYRKNVLEEKAIAAKVSGAETEAKQKKVDLQKSTYETTAKGIETAASFAPQLTKENYGDWYNWVDESNFLPEGMFVAPKEVDNFTSGQFLDYKKKIEGFKKVDPKTVDYAVKTYAAETTRKLGEEKLRIEREKNVLLNQQKANAERNKNVLAQEERDIKREKLTLEARKYTDLTADQESKARMIDEKSFLDNEAIIFQADDEGIPQATKQIETKPLVDAFNRKAKKLGVNEKIVWDENAGIEVPGVIPYTTKKVGGYVKVPAEDVIKEAPLSALELLKTNPELAEQFKQKYGYLPGE